MRAYVSLWSADLLALGDAVEALADVVDGFHIDVFDGHRTRELLFGPDLVAALRRRTTALLDVHLMVTDPAYWADRFADAGADMITVHMGPGIDIDATLERIRDLGCQPSLGLETHQGIDQAVAHFPAVSRVLVLGTAIGVRGVGLDPATAGRVASLAEARGSTGDRPLLVVDGGIRRHTVPALAAAGADGVVPGSLVFDAQDPRKAVTEIKALT
ncbi:ribulose-phosphate 3-epimerase [Actinopolymorpha sp. B17G11]|uniref:ribulose-phosphate 3-epimerase n=1 Tax=Actinopolymorpha sp. B17G11 TaxID=3160861 RepID=UPI0032E5043B